LLANCAPFYKSKLNLNYLSSTRLLNTLPVFSAVLFFRKIWLVFHLPLLTQVTYLNHTFKKSFYITFFKSKNKSLNFIFKSNSNTISKLNYVNLILSYNQLLNAYFFTFWFIFRLRLFLINISLNLTIRPKLTFKAENLLLCQFNNKLL
jgi:hypothetical protein